jgi:hypothetical protein
MATKYKLINEAQKRSDEIQQVVGNIKTLADFLQEDPVMLMENAIQVVAGLKGLMSAGKPLTQAGMSPSSVAGVVAGLRVLTRALPKITDEQKRTRALAVLGDIKMGEKMSLGSTTAIANLASKDPQADELRAAFEQYAKTGQPNPAVIKLLGQLQIELDQALRAASQQQKPAGTPLPAMASSAVGSTGQAR